MKRLLIADDDAGMRAALEARFQRRGWQVDVAVNGTEALAKFREGLHSLVITDVRMPGRDGFELMREEQTSSARTAVILLTANSDSFGETAYPLRCHQYGECRKPKADVSAIDGHVSHSPQGRRQPTASRSFVARRRALQTGRVPDPLDHVNPMWRSAEGR